MFWFLQAAFNMALVIWMRTMSMNLLSRLSTVRPRVKTPCNAIPGHLSCLTITVYYSEILQIQPIQILITSAGPRTVPNVNLFRR